MKKSKLILLPLLALTLASCEVSTNIGNNNVESNSTENNNFKGKNINTYVRNINHKMNNDVEVQTRHQYKGYYAWVVIDEPTLDIYKVGDQITIKQISEYKYQFVDWGWVDE